MSDSFTDNVGLSLQVTGENVGTWGTDVNNNLTTILDQVLGKTLTVPLVASNVALTEAQRQNLAFKLTGVLAANIIITFPLSINSSTVAEGGLFVFDNQTTGAYTVTVKTIASGSTGVAVPQGLRSLLYSNGTNIYFADDAVGGGAKFKGYNGNPNGVVTGTAASATTLADALWDYTNLSLYVSQGGTVWAGGASAIDVTNATGVLPIAHGGTGQTTAQTARGGSGLNVESQTTTSANASYTILLTDRVVATSGTAMTAGNTWTLPAANTLTAGQGIWVVDMSGVVGVVTTGTYTLTVARAGSDTISGATSVGITVRFNGFLFISDGSSKWTAFLYSLTGTGPTGYTASGGITLTGGNFTLDTDNSLGIGSTAVCHVRSGDIANGSTTDGSNLDLMAGYYAGGTWLPAVIGITGTWRNVSGVTLGNGVNFQFGFFIRTA